MAEVLSENDVVRIGWEPEIGAVHALSDHLITQLDRAAQQAQRAQLGPVDPGGGEPFGFAAFTSLAKSQRQTKAAENRPDPGGRAH